METARAIARFDLEFHLWESEQGLNGLLIYSTELFEAETIERLLKHYERLLTAVVAHPEQRVSAVELLSEAEEQQLLVEWNQTSTATIHRRSIAELFEEQVAQGADEIAIVFDAES